MSPPQRIEQPSPDGASRLGRLLRWLCGNTPADIEASYLRNLYGNFIYHGPLSVFAGLYLYLAAPRLPDLAIIPPWVICFITYHAVRAAVGIAFQRLPDEVAVRQVRRWAFLSVLLHALGGALMLTLALKVYPELEFMAQTILLMAVLVIVGTSAFNLAGRWIEIAVYAPPIYLGFAWTTWFLAHDYAKPVSVLVLVFFGLYLFQARNQHASNVRSFALARRNGELAGELQVKNAELQEVAAARSRLLATVSHDLRQPAHAIGLLCERAMLDQSPNFVQTALRDLNELSQSLSASLTTLMDLTRLDAGLVKANTAPVPLNQILLRLEAEFSGSARAKGLALHIPGTQLWVWSDAVLLHGILANLLSNAIKYTRQGRIELELVQAAPNLTITVRDTGVGIEQTKLDVIFKEFVRLDADESGTEGLGLGLSIVRRYAALLRHPLSVASAPQQGTSFSIALPVVAPQARPVAVEAVAASATDTRLAGLRVLVVDNVDLVLSSMVRTLSAWGCVVHSASNLAGAKEVAAAHALDVVITDFHLGDRQPDGLALVVALRQLLPASAAQPLALLMTGDVSSQLETNARQCQVGILHKPVRPAVLQTFLLDQLHLSLPGVPAGA